MTRRRVLKFPIDGQPWTVPLRHKVVLAGKDGTGRECIWVEVQESNPAGPERRVLFRVFATGEEVPREFHHHYSWIDGVYV